MPGKATGPIGPTYAGMLQVMERSRAAFFSAPPTRTVTAATDPAGSRGGPAGIAFFFVRSRRPGQRPDRARGTGYRVVEVGELDGAGGLLGGVVEHRDLGGTRDRRLSQQRSHWHDYLSAHTAIKPS